MSLHRLLDIKGSRSYNPTFAQSPSFPKKPPSLLLLSPCPARKPVKSSFPIPIISCFKFYLYKQVVRPCSMLDFLLRLRYNMYKT
nr:MAG TPA: hypothetical protein [Caudoviricetes sp.]